MTSASLPWVALAVGVAGVGAAAWQERAGSRAVARSRPGPHRGPSLEEIRVAIAPLGMKVRRVEGEYRVVFNDYDQSPRGKRDEELAAYYTMDADDALETARDMARRRAEVIAQRAARKPGRGSRGVKDITAQEKLARDIFAEIKSEEDAFAATVKAGDLVQWKEWVWERSITENDADPEVSARVTFVGVVDRVARDENVLYVDPMSVRPSVKEIRQRPRCRLPISAFSYADLKHGVVPRKPRRGSRAQVQVGDFVDVVGFLQRQSGPRTVSEIVLGVFGAPGPWDHDGAERERAVRRALAAGGKDILNFRGQEYWAAPRAQVHPGRAR